MSHKGIVLYSGGLDSLLTAKLLMNQGIDVTGFHCILPFVPRDFVPEKSGHVRLAYQIGLPLVFYKCGSEYLNMVRNPAHGRGKHINPCIDCKIFFIKKAAEYMKETGADFVATGEVVGQRPMSQLKHTINHIANVTGLNGRLLRPLSAKLLKPTVVEEQGIVDRSRLLDISGRGRFRQMELAKELGITEYASPAGGCLMTDAAISRRMDDLFAHTESCTAEDTWLLTVGRHFRLNESQKLIVARNEAEGRELKKLASVCDAFFEPEFKGPPAMLCGHLTDEAASFAVSVICRYGKPESEPGKILITVRGTRAGELTPSLPASEEILRHFRI